MDVRKEFAVDKTAVEEGKWFPLGEKAKIKMRSYSSDVVQAYRRRALAPYAVFSDNNRSLPEGVEDQVSKDTLIDVIILDWEGLTDDGEPMPYSKENAIMLMEEAEGFMALLVQILVGSDSFKAESLKVEEKN